MIFAIAYQKSKEDGSLPSQIEEKQLEHLTRTRQDNKEIIKMMRQSVIFLN
jgi:hypothetical protein